MAEVEHVELRAPSPLNTSLPIPSTMDTNELGPPPPNTPPSQLTADAFTAETRDFWVSPPPLHPDQKREYKKLPQGAFQDVPTDDEDETPNEVVGEIRFGTELFYWVEYQNGVVHKHNAREFKKSHRDLVDAYSVKKDEGLLEDFDPTSSKVHPTDRPRHIITIPPQTARYGPPGRGRGRTKRSNLSRTVKQKSSVVDSDDEEHLSQPEYVGGSDDDDEDEEGFKRTTRKIQPPTRRSARGAVSNTKANYRDASESPVKTRTNPKRRAATKDDEDDYEDLSDELEAEYEEPKPKKKKPVRGRLSRPAYGNIRPVADLSDDDSDDGTAPLRAHRSTCEKCQEPPAHELLAKYHKRGKKKAKPKKKSKPDDDFEDGDQDEEEDRILAMGGWVRCLKCCVTAHWKCLAAIQRDEILRATRSKDKEAEAAGLLPPKRDTLGASETTEFICGLCIKGGICMFCLETAVEVEAPPERKEDVGTEPRERAESVPRAKTAEDALLNKDMSMHTPPPAIIVSVPTPQQDKATVLDNSSVGNLQAPEPSRDASPPPDVPQENLFRCITCKRLAHYKHLPQPSTIEILTPVDLARHYQEETEWKCSDCVSFVDPLEKILAWRPYPANVVEPPRLAGEVQNHKERLPREYLVKWAGRSYRRLSWVPHMWLLSTNATKLKNFLATGPKVQLLAAPTEELEDKGGKDALEIGTSAKEPSPSFLIVDENSREPSTQPGSSEEEGPSSALPDAERRIPPGWTTIDRVLDIRLWDPEARKRVLQQKKAKARKKNRKRKGTGKRARIESDSDSEAEDVDGGEFDAEAEAEYLAARQQGQEPNEDFLETLDQWEARTGTTLAEEHAELVIWAFVKWNDLAYEEATWDSPPGPSEGGWAAFVQAFQRFLESRQVFVAKKDRKAIKDFDTRPKAMFDQRNIALETDPELGQDETSKLLDFQLTGINWLFRNWWRHQPSILADEMGLGKTVQIAGLVGHLIGAYEAFPVLIAVPNSTITNWLREFARWAPKLRVVPFNGDSKSRDIIREYELYHDSTPKGFTNLKFHVLVTTYETLIGKDFNSVFKSVPRWELLVIDEGQRLKSDSSLLFKKLNELKTIHRILMTGTPLNNNIRELFNLMNFLDPEKWNDLDNLEKKYETLTEGLLDELHEALKPYFLRRTKADVLKLPPKNEVIVPVSMTAIQKEVYKSLFSQNMEILGTLAQPSSGVNSAVKKSNLNNLLMQLRKCLQHPYLISRDLEPTGPELTQMDIHRNLLDASAKLRLLHTMLPKLKARGHRVLLFSQFVIGLDIIEDFIAGEGHKFLRLDGNTKQAQRQKDMDTFNRPNSDVFIYLLSTRAGGVGINLWSADTVIIFDPDFNPHQDLQAISRAHRYGQTKPVLVFKLMVKGAAEERIVQTGKKKLALDHLIVQQMDDDGATDDVQSILTFGAKAIFEDAESHDINYTDADIDNLIERTEKEGDDMPENTKSQLSFGFAKLWVVERDSLEEISEDAPADTENDGFWNSVLARATAEKEKAKAAEVTGRGAKRRAAISQTYKYDDDGSPAKPKPKKRKKSTGDSDIEYHVSNIDSGSEMGPSGPSTVDGALLSDEEEMLNPLNASEPKADKIRSRYKPALAAIENRKRVLELEESDDERMCGLCRASHGPGSCFMTQNPSNLVDYRSMLLTESPEPVNLRREAVGAIDRHLASRGLSHLIKGQPINFPNQDDANSQRKKKRKERQNDTLKRPASPEASSSNKKAKLHTPPAIKCDICGGLFHLAKKCPVVKQGPESIKQAISRLESDPRNLTTVNILQSFLTSSSPHLG